MPKQIDAYQCDYCGNSMICSYEQMVEHEKMCNCNPNKVYCNCRLCIHGKTSSYDTTDRWGRTKTVYFGKCTKGFKDKFVDFYNYCPEFIKKGD